MKKNEGKEVMGVIGIMGNYRKLWETMGNYGELWGIVGTNYGEYEDYGSKSY